MIPRWQVCDFDYRNNAAESANTLQLGAPLQRDYRARKEYSSSLRRELLLHAHRSRTHAALPSHQPISAWPPSPSQSATSSALKYPPSSTRVHVWVYARLLD